MSDKKNPDVRSDKQSVAKSQKTSRASANSTVGRVIGAVEGEDKVTTAEKALATMRFAGMDKSKEYRQMVAMLEKYKAENNISGTPKVTPAEAIATGAKGTKGPKLGRALASQSAQYSVGELEKTVAKAELKGKLVKTATVSSKDLTKAAGKDIAAIAAKTGAPRASAAMARGVDGHNSPHSAKSLGDSAAKERAATKAAKAEAKQPKAKPEPKQATKDQKLTVLVKNAADTAIRPDSDRFHKLAFVISAKPKMLSDVLGKEYVPGKRLDMGSIGGMVKRQHIRLG